ncbi:hypothetical protein [Mycoplasma sp. SG1]|uniref:hypothetical protein n=1 Tax=Mycoplasma sp. SG1 TaxID=2810348 RepID=UPI0020257EDC|nr:hypothetical protein [Mycoplasma sp. SG1]URM52936.1 hypothetical protein JRW51_01145 [Mycoplasma sp. SG1]
MKFFKNKKLNKYSLFFSLSLLPLTLFASCGSGDNINPNKLFGKLIYQAHKKICGDNYLYTCDSSNITSLLSSYLTDNSFDKQFQILDDGKSGDTTKQHTDTLKLLPFIINGSIPYQSGDITPDSITWDGWFPMAHGQKSSNPLSDYFVFNIEDKSFTFYTTWSGSNNPTSKSFEIPNAKYDVTFHATWDDSNNISDFKIDSITNESYINDGFDKKWRSIIQRRW